jgi:hypothetical protein
MLKSGLIAAAVMLVLTIGTTLISPYCVPCLAILVGLGAGALGGQFDKPVDLGACAKSGAAAGAIGGLGAIVGHLVGGVINAVVVGPEGAARVLSQIGFSSSTMTPTTYYAFTFGAACCIGLVDVLLMAGLGALGGLLWWQLAGKSAANPGATMLSPR